MGLAFFIAARRRQAEAAQATEPAPAEAPKPEGDPRAGYSVEARKGGWHALIGPDGQVGSSQRSEAEAWALLEG